MSNKGRLPPSGAPPEPIEPPRGRALAVERQSSLGQVLQHRASQLVQGQQVEHAAALGFRTDEVERVRLQGESARPFAPRPQFEHGVLARAARGDVSHILTYGGDRLYRSLPDHARLMEVAQRHNIRIVVDGREYDPLDEDDELFLGLDALLAVADGRRLAKRFGRARVAAANARTMWLPVPNGLLWAGPADAGLEAAMADAGFAGDLAADAANAGRRMEVVREGRRVAPFRVPDVQAAESFALLFQFMREEGCIGGVCARVREDPRWPRPGLFPWTGLWWHPEYRVRWRPLAFHFVSHFLLSPGTYGIYAYAAAAAAARARTSQERARCAVWVEGAWTGYAPPDEYAAMLRLHLEHSRHRAPRWGAAAPRNHVLAEVRCAHPRPDGSPCGRRMGAKQLPASDPRPHAYHVTGVTAEGRAALGHTCAGVDHRLDDAVLAVLGELFGVAQVADCVGRLTAPPVAGAADVRREAAAVIAAEKRVERLKARLERAEVAVVAAELATELAAELAARGVPRETDAEDAARAAAFRAECDRDLASATAERDALVARRGERAASHAALAKRVAEDLQAIERLAADIPALLARAGAAEQAGRVTGARRQLVRELVRAVHVRRVGQSTYVAAIEFPTGERVERTVVTRAVAATAAERAWCAGRMAEGADPDDVARELHAITGGRRNLLAHSRQVAPWTASRVEGVAHTAAHLVGLPDAPDRARGRPGEAAGASDVVTAWESAAALAARVGRARADVLRPALRGRLGHAARYADGDLYLAPPETALHRAFPAYATRAVAAAAGVPVDAIGTVNAVRLAIGMTYAGVVLRAGGKPGLLRDLAGRPYVVRARVAGPPRTGPRAPHAAGDTRP